MSEQRRLRLLGRLAAAWLDGTRPAPEGSPEPRELTALARSQRLAPVLDDLSRRRGWPHGLLEEPPLRLARAATALRNRQLLASAGSATAALHRAGIPVARLKGADLALGVYPDPALRPMEDIDLLVPAGAVEDAVRLLGEVGFRLPEGALPVRHYLRHHFHLALVDGARRSYLELHWELLDEFRRGDLKGEGALAASVPFRPDRPDLGRRLDGELRLLYLALHIDKHGPFHAVLLPRLGAHGTLLHPSTEAKLLWFLDLALVSRDPDIDWDRLRSRAHACGVYRGLATSLRMGRDLLGPGCFSAEGGAWEEPACGPWRSSVEGLVGRILVGGGTLSDRLVRRSMKMHKALHVRPLRLLELPLVLLPPPSEAARRTGRGPFGRLYRYPLGVVRRLGRVLRLAASLLVARARGAR